MPLQNRVLPTGEIVAIPERGTLTGNRGILHDGHRRLGTARWRHKNWVCCLLDFKGRRRPLMAPGTWTELFFLDEAVALAAGHRPCAYCRRADYLRFRDAWHRATGQQPKAPQIDTILHGARVQRDRSQVRHTARIESLPAGTLILHDARAHLLTPRGLHPYAPDGYRPCVATPAGQVTVLTPAPTVAALTAGYVPHSHSTAGTPHQPPPIRDPG